LILRDVGDRSPVILASIGGAKSIRWTHSLSCYSALSHPLLSKQFELSFHVWGIILTPFALLRSSLSLSRSPDNGPSDHQITIERLVDWDDEDVQNEPKAVTGSVVEFAFGDAPHSYFVTSYPYRAEYADRSDIRTMAM
jgi:hypothetical protein